MAAIQSNIDGQKLKKTTSTRPQTAAFNKESNLKQPKTGIPGLGGSNLLKKLKSDNTNGVKAVDQRSIKTPKVQLNNSTLNENQGKFQKLIYIGFGKDVEKMLNANIENAHKLRKESKNRCSNGYKNSNSIILLLHYFLANRLM